MLNLSFILFFLACFCNVAVCIPAGDEPRIWSGKLTGEALYQSGNTSKFFIQGKGDIKRTTAELEMIMAASIGYGESKGLKDDNVIAAAFTADLFHDRTFSPFILQLLEYNFAKGIDIRSQSGGGLKYLFIKDPDLVSSASLALIYDYTDLADKPGNYTTGKLRFSFRLKSRLVLLDSNAILSFVGFYQPALEDLKAANLRAETVLEVPITKLVFARAAYNYSFEDVVSVGRQRLDNKITFGLGMGF